MRKKVEKDTKMEKEILEAAKKLFFVEGKLHATMQDIADEVKVSRPVVNYYFRTKDMLMEIFYKEVVECTVKRLDFVFESESDFYKGISNYVEDTLTHRDEYPYLDIFMVIEMNCRPLTADLSFYKVEKFERFLDIAKMEMDKGTILKTDPVNFLFDMFSLITYPIVIGPLYKNILNINDVRYKKIVADRKEIILKRLFAK